MTAADSADEGLKPCPFCNNSTEQKVVRSLTITDYGNDGFFALCDAATGHVGCGASSPWKETPELAIAAWNRRATPAPVPSAEELSAEEINWIGDSIKSSITHLFVNENTRKEVQARVDKLCAQAKRNCK